jgi:hypothetical protein
MEPFPLRTDPSPLAALCEPPKGGARAEGNGALRARALLEILALGAGAGVCASAELES